MLDAILGHRGWRRSSSSNLSCQADMVPFYERWRFEDSTGRSVLTRRTAR
ncbi:MAG TPA: hypothetical protein VFX51_05075 [Solirubrobacteraceae bacterium]|nr:hypothetical protein [Solirubrobacteraceae bacterium]